MRRQAEGTQGHPSYGGSRVGTLQNETDLHKLSLIVVQWPISGSQPDGYL
jgi:hypothetical protein